MRLNLWDIMSIFMFIKPDDLRTFPYIFVSHSESCFSY